MTFFITSGPAFGAKKNMDGDTEERKQPRSIPTKAPKEKENRETQTTIPLINILLYITVQLGYCDSDVLFVYLFWVMPIT